MSQPRILYYDIETSYLITKKWGVWDEGVIGVVTDWQILSVAWQWEGQKKVNVIGQDDFDDYVPGVNDDYNVVLKIWELFDEADAVVAHNGNSFDQKKARARMIAHNMTPPSPYREIDTKLMAKRIGAFTSNRLKDLANALDIHRKGDPGGIETWDGCLAGDLKAWAKMKRYNKQDIPPLRDLYLRLRAWTSNSVPMNMYGANFSLCPTCGKGPMHNKGIQVSKVSKFQRWQCQNCGAYSRTRLADFMPEKPDFV